MVEMEASGPSETLVPVYHIVWCDILENLTLSSDCSEYDVGQMSTLYFNVNILINLSHLYTHFSICATFTVQKGVAEHEITLLNLISHKNRCMYLRSVTKSIRIGFSILKFVLCSAVHPFCFNITPFQYE
jgi:hypothetical protein